MDKTKKKVSAFEYALTEIFEPEATKNLSPRTREEELQYRRENIKRQLSKFKIKEGE